MVSFPDDHNISQSNHGPIYHLNFLRFFPLGVWSDTRQAWGLVPFSGGVRGSSFVLLKSAMIKVYEEIWKSLHVSTITSFIDSFELQGSMLSLPVHYGLAIELLNIEVWTIIIWMVISWVTWPEGEGFDMVGAEYRNLPVVKMTVMAIIEEDLWINLVWSTDFLEMHHCLHIAIHVHIFRWCIVE